MNLNEKKIVLDVRDVCVFVEGHLRNTAHFDSAEENTARLGNLSEPVGRRKVNVLVVNWTKWSYY